jgi:internalin A
LRGLADLSELRLSFNKIKDISILSNLKNLKTLALWENKIEDISSLSTLKDLRYIDLDNNSITDLTPLYNLTGLWDLYISGNPVTEGQVDALRAALPNCDIMFEEHFDYLDLSFEYIDDNELAELIADGTIPADVVNLNLGVNEISALTPLKNLPELEHLLLFWNQIEDVSPLSGLTGLKFLDLNYNEISDVTPLYSLVELETLLLNGNPLTDEQVDALRAALPNCWIEFYEKLDILDLSYEYINNIRLYELIADGTIPQDVMYLNLSFNEITDLTPLKILTDLRWLSLWNNQIEDVSPLSELTALYYLDLDENLISDVTALYSLVNLETLFLSYNLLTEKQVDDLQKALPECNVEFDEPPVFYDLSNENIDNKQLAELIADGTIPADVTILLLGENNITDSTPLKNLTKLKVLDLSLNQLEDISPLSSLVKLEVLGLSANRITDLTPLYGLSNLYYLELSANPLYWEQLTDLEEALPYCEIFFITEYLPGDVLGKGQPTIAGVLEILKYLAGMNSALDDEYAYYAACITGDEPKIGDVLEILKWLAGMKSALDPFYFK